MRRECRERFPRHRLQRKPLVSDPGMHHGMCMTHVPWCMSGSLTFGDGKTFPALPAHAQRAIFRIWLEAHGRCGSNSNSIISNSLYKAVAWALYVTLFSRDCHRTSLMINQHWFRRWLGAVRHQAITWTNVNSELCHHMTSLSRNEIIKSIAVEKMKLHPVLLNRCIYAEMPHCILQISSKTTKPPIHVSYIFM